MKNTGLITGLDTEWLLNDYWIDIELISFGGGGSGKVKTKQARRLRRAARLFKLLLLVVVGGLIGYA